MEHNQKISHLFVWCSVQDAKEKYKFSDADIETYTVRTEHFFVVEIPIDNYQFDRSTIEFDGHSYITVDKPVIIIVQDEAIFRLYDGAKEFWKLKGKQKLRHKGEGKGVMASAFLSEQLGFISISREQLQEINAQRAVLRKPPLQYYIEQAGRIYPSIHLF